MRPPRIPPTHRTMSDPVVTRQATNRTMSATEVVRQTTQAVSEDSSRCLRSSLEVYEAIRAVLRAVPVQDITKANWAAMKAEHVHLLADLEIALNVNEQCRSRLDADLRRLREVTAMFLVGDDK